MERIFNPDRIPPEKRLVITGASLITPKGVTLAENIQAFTQGQSVVSKLSEDEFRLCETLIAGRFPPDIIEYIDSQFSNSERRKTRSASRTSTVAVRDAVLDAGFTIGANGVFAPDRSKIMTIGTGTGDMPRIIEENELFQKEGFKSRALTLAALRLLIERIATVPGMKYGINGRTKMISAACATGSYAFTDVCEALNFRHPIKSRSKYAKGVEKNGDLGIAGAVETGTIPIVIGLFNALGALSKRNDAPELASRPWDKDRDGFVFTDAAATMIIEPLHLALARNAEIYAEILGWYDSADANPKKPAEPDEDNVLETMKWACLRAGVPTSRLNYIKAHGTSTPIGDLIEARAMKRLLGRRHQDVMIASLKGMLGHPVGASGAVELGLTAWMIKNQKVFANKNLDNLDPEIPELNFVLPEQQNGNLIYLLDAELDAVLCNSFGFGGLNSCVVLGRYRKGNLIAS